MKNNENFSRQCRNRHHFNIAMIYCIENNTNTSEISLNNILARDKVSAFCDKLSSQRQHLLMCQRRNNQRYCQRIKAMRNSLFSQRKNCRHFMMRNIYNVLCHCLAREKLSTFDDEQFTTITCVELITAKHFFEIIFSQFQ